MEHDRSLGCTIRQRDEDEKIMAMKEAYVVRKMKMLSWGGEARNMVFHRDLQVKDDVNEYKLHMQ